MEALKEIVKKLRKQDYVVGDQNVCLVEDDGVSEVL